MLQGHEGHDGLWSSKSFDAVRIAVPIPRGGTLSVAHHQSFGLASLKTAAEVDADIKPSTPNTPRCTNSRSSSMTQKPKPSLSATTPSAMNSTRSSRLCTQPWYQALPRLAGRRLPEACFGFPITFV
ncbi:hypothetical protein HGRIS_014471 [Hohenbuehelia grisea]|uniref:Uncharacterized protein n=1 Tax=Hohenbuehelia grisea TaxID=104357 RepID=A0ABR3JUY9_9AGAR